MLDLLKLILVILGYLVLPPILGYLLAQKRQYQTVAFGFLVYILVLRPSLITFNLEPVEWYRGHTKGFEFTLMEMISLALIYSTAMAQTLKLKFFPPGSGVYLFSVALACLSYFSTYNPLFTSMAVFKFSKVVLVFIAAYNYLQEENDIKVYLKVISVALVIHMFVGINDRYLQGIYRARGWFEHENSMAQWTYFCGLPLLGAALARQTAWRESLLYFAGYGAAGIMVVLSLSRAALAIYILGTVVIAGALLLCRVTCKRLILVGLLTLGSTVVLSVSYDSIRERFATASDSDQENDLRWILNEMSREMLKDHPTGVGWNNFGVVNSRPIYRYSQMLEAWESNRFGFQLPVKQFYKNPLTESLYWCMLAEVGYPGFFGYILFMGVTYWYAVRAWLVYYNTFIGTVLFGLVVMLTLLYVHSSVERILTQHKNLATWMLVLGMISKIKVLSRDVEQRQMLPGLFLEWRQFHKWLTIDLITGARGRGRSMVVESTDAVNPSSG